MNLDGCFGMVEMESAALRIIMVCEGQRTWFCSIRYTDMETDQERIGFLQLLYYSSANGRGWLVCFLEKDQFFVGESFVETVRSRLGDSSLAQRNAPTFEEWFERRMSPAAWAASTEPWPK